MSNLHEDNSGAEHGFLNLICKKTYELSGSIFISLRKSNFLYWNVCIYMCISCFKVLSVLSAFCDLHNQLCWYLYLHESYYGKNFWLEIAITIPGLLHFLFKFYLSFYLLFLFSFHLNPESGLLSCSIDKNLHTACLIRKFLSHFITIFMFCLVDIGFE